MRLGYVIYDKKYVSFWIDDAETEDEAKYEKRKLIIKVDTETVGKYNEINDYFNTQSIVFKDVNNFKKWLQEQKSDTQ